MMFISIFFFFSSRRRHTRLQGDWSSDVCSSGLNISLLLLFSHRSTISTLETRDTILLIRSEEHTSELQSPCNLVCRLLLEKKSDVIGITDGGISRHRRPVRTAQVLLLRRASFHV